MVACLILSLVLLGVGVPLWLWDRNHRCNDEGATPAAGQCDDEIVTLAAGDSCGDENLTPAGGSCGDEVDTLAGDGCSDGCCTTHEVCPSQELLKGLGEAAVYYDDEHLDCYASRAAHDYTDEEVEEFRDVLYTLIPADRLGWCKSLKKRNITMPSPIHDEFLMLVGENIS